MIKFNILRFYMTKAFLSERKYVDFATMYEDSQNILKDILSKNSDIKTQELIKNIRKFYNKIS